MKFLKTLIRRFLCASPSRSFSSRSFSSLRLILFQCLQFKLFQSIQVLTGLHPTKNGIHSRYVIHFSINTALYLVEWLSNPCLLEVVPKVQQKDLSIKYFASHFLLPWMDDPQSSTISLSDILFFQSRLRNSAQMIRQTIKFSLTFIRTIYPNFHWKLEAKPLLVRFFSFPFNRSKEMVVALATAIFLANCYNAA